MLSYIFGALGEVVAPKVVDPKDELLTYLRARQFTKAVQLLRCSERAKDVDLHVLSLDTGYAAIHIAAACGEIDLLNEVVTRNTDINLQAGNGNTALHLAALNSHLNIVSYLLRAGADLSIPNTDGLVAFELASNVDIKKLLSKCPSSLCVSPTPTSTTLKETMSSTPILFQGLPGTESSVHCDAKLALEILDAAKETSKTIVMSAGDIKILGDIFKGCNIGHTATGDSAFLNFKKIISLDPSYANIRYGKLKSHYSYDGATPLHCAAQSGNLKAVEFLLSLSNVSSWTKDLQGRTALHLAAEDQSKNEAICLLLQEAMVRETGIDPIGSEAPVDINGITPIGYARTSVRKHLTPIMREKLFRPGDKSICPKSPLPATSSKFNTENSLIHACSYTEGWNNYMEDRLVRISPFYEGCSLFAVLDGHGGKFSAEFLTTCFPTVLKKHLKSLPVESLGSISDITTLLYRVCLECDEQLYAVPRMRRGDMKSALDGSGSTLVAAIVTPNRIYACNVGDSRCILAKKGTGELSLVTVALTDDHKPNIHAEKQRIEAAGYSVFDENGDVKIIKDPSIHPSKQTALSMSRAFGDFAFKSNTEVPAEQQAVICVPDIRVMERSSDDVFLLLACDGIFDVMKNEEVIIFIKSRMKEISMTESEATILCAALLQEALDRGAEDNLTAVFVSLLDTVTTTSVSSDFANLTLNDSPAVKTPSLAPTPTTDDVSSSISSIIEETERVADEASPIHGKRLFDA